LCPHYLLKTLTVNCLFDVDVDIDVGGKAFPHRTNG
jgi:hypothetical protein